jgi:hypothetical protein
VHKDLPVSIRTRILVGGLLSAVIAHIHAVRCTDLCPLLPALDSKPTQDQDKQRYDGTLYAPGESKTDSTLVQVVSEVLKSDDYVSMMQNRQAGENEHESLLAVGILKELSIGVQDDEQSFSPTAMRALVDSMKYLKSKRDPWYKDMTREVLCTLGLLAEKSQKIWEKTEKTR